MKLALMNIDKFIAANHIQEVTNPILMDRGYHPTSDGVLSTDIFGSSTESRRNTFAYITLNTHMLQPLAYKTLLRLDRRIDDIISGIKNFSISKTGELVPDEEKGNTGVEWLYANWEKIKFKKNDSSVRNQRIHFLELHTKKELFQDKELIVPAFYRDINLTSRTTGKPSTHKVNQLYCRLIRLANMLEQGNFAFNLDHTRYQMQQLLVEIYDEFKARVEKKRGIIKQAILGKSIDYGARLVISNTKFMAERPSDMLVDFTHVGVPLSYAISLFTPFVIGWVQSFFKREFELTGMKYPVTDAKTNQVEYLKLLDPMLQFNDDKIHDMMKTYIYSHAQRFDPIILECENGKKVAMKYRGNHGLDTSEKEDIELTNPNRRHMTLTDLFYLALTDITADKHVYITRYPMADYMGIYPCGISIISTNDTEEMSYNGKLYKHYPKVDLRIDKSKISTLFSEVINMQNTYLSSIGGDYDGRGVAIVYR